MTGSPSVAPFFSLAEDGVIQNAIDVLKYPDYEDGDSPRTVLELELCDIGGAIRDRQEWWTKIYDEKIVSKWREESGGETNALKFEFALSECKWVAETYKGPARPAAADGTYSNDGIDSSLLQRLLKGINKIRTLEVRDTHPGSDDLVVDIIHPSLYCYEQGVTPVIGEADVFEMPVWSEFVINMAGKPDIKVADVDIRMCSRSGLQWLPAEFVVSKDMSAVKINSYINSLHPVIYSEMYDAIGDAFLLCVPLLEHVLSELGTVDSPYERPLRVSDSYAWRGSEPSYHSDEDDNNDRWALFLPEVPASFDPPPVSKPPSLADKKLQVIVKIASIELTPDKPSYDGGSWHVEGTRNERIVATACCYLESLNCTESMLEFRTAVSEPDYHQCDNYGVEQMYGLLDEKPLLQRRGASRTLEGRILAWPNTLQHRVRNFELADKTRPGRRTILCFFLVDPNLRVRSTATVPPQNKKWIEIELEKTMSKIVPVDVVARIVHHLDGLSFEEACERRIRLMEERKKEVKLNASSDWEGPFFERIFSLCEH